MHICSTGDFGGGATYLLSLAAKMNRDKVLQYFVIPEEGELSCELRRRGFDVKVLDLERRFNPVSILRLARMMKESGIDAVHTHDPRTNLYGFLAGRIARARALICTIHCFLHDYPIGRLKKRIYLIIDNFNLRYAKTIVCVSNAIAEDLVKSRGLPKERIIVIHNAVDLDRVKAAKNSQEIGREFACDNPGRLIGTVGRMTSEKGHMYLIQALALLAEKFPALKCVIVGDGPLRPELETKCRELGLERVCIFTGVRTDVPNLLSIMDVFVLPSLSEGFGIALLEAMAMGKPVVATRIGGIPEVVEDGVTGLLVQPGDPKTLANGILEMLSDKERSLEMGRRGREVVSKHFTLESMVAEMEKVYLALLN